MTVFFEDDEFFDLEDDAVDYLCPRCRTELVTTEVGEDVYTGMSHYVSYCPNCGWEDEVV